jgi:hypothetical protein
MDRIRAQIAADAILQAEMTRALVAIADSLPHAGDLRVVRIVSRTLEASWQEHVSFQDKVVFPIVIGRHPTAAAETVERLRIEHSALSLAHGDVGRQLQDILARQVSEAAPLVDLLRTTCDGRRRHLDADAELDRLLPASFSVPEGCLCEEWVTQRPAPRFPLNVLWAGGREKFRLQVLLH